MSIHDPRTGFHDIKGLNTLQENPPFILGYILIAILTVTALYYLSKYFKNRVIPKLMLSPTQKALNELEKSLTSLKTQSLTPREHSSNSSLILREYLGHSFNFNATELTNLEVINKLANSTKNIAQENRKELYKMTKLALKAFEKNTFADELEFQIEEFENVHNQAKQIIELADRCLKNNGL